MSPNPEAITTNMDLVAFYGALMVEFSLCDAKRGAAVRLMEGEGGE